MRRAFVGLMGAAFVVALVLLPSDAARGQKRVPPAPPGGGPGVPGAPGTQPGVNDLADKGRLTLPTDPKKKRKLEAVRDYIKSGDWETVAREVQELLDLPTDVFVQMPVKQPDGKEVDTLVGIRVAANRLLAGLPRDTPGQGLDAYNQMHKGHAKELLTQAINDGDRQKFADVAQRYLWTDAGGEAAERLATILLDRGDFMAAAQAFDRLIQRDGIEKLEPLTLYKAAIAFNRGNSKEDRENKDKVWKQLQAKAPDGLNIGGQSVALEDAQKYLDRIRGGVNTSVYDWPMVGGNPSRSGQGVGDTPFMVARWHYSLFSGENSPVKKWIVGDERTVIGKLSGKGEAVIPAFAPVTATVVRDGKTETLVIYRDYDGVAAVSLKTGKRMWIARSHWSMEDMLRPGQGQKGASLNAWVQQFKDMHNKPGVLIENSTVGTLSSDGNRVYFIDDLQVPPYFQQQFNQPWGGMPQPGMGLGMNQDVKAGVEANKLQAVSLASGKLFWELGGPKAGEGDGAGLKHDFKDSYFLGPPLCLGGKLYFLNEKKEEIRLCCLDTSKLPARDPQSRDLDAAIAWVQPLGTAKEKILADYSRRMNATQIAYGEGILVCPTNAGVILGVDLLTHSLLWAHTYSDAPVPQQPVDPYGRFRGGFPGQPQPQPNQPIVTDWKASPPIITDGKVVFTAPDGPELRCLNLRNGAQAWGLKRSDGDVYLAGVFAGRVVIVGKKDVRALSLDDARELWRIPTGMPSGRGVASGNVYYVPLKEAIFSDKEKGPGIYAIDVEHGKLVAQTRSKKKDAATPAEVPGNLTFFDGEVISQSATEVVAYPQLKVKLELMNQLLARNPQDPRGLFERGELRLDKGERAGAVEDLRASLANNPPADLKTKVQTKLFDAMTELLQHDFGSGEKYLKEYEGLCKVTGGDDAARETQRREANFLCLVAKGREEQGKFDEALKAYLKFGSLPTAQDELLSVVTEPAVKARPDVWARGRIKAMLERATPDQRKPLEEVISADWASVKASGDLERLRHFVSMFGDTAAIGKEGQLFLAERLMERPGKADMLDAETQFLKLAQDDDDAFVARALDGLARLCTRKGELEDAYRYYQTMRDRFPAKVVRDGKTGSQLLDELATDKRFLQYMDEAGEPPVGKHDAAEPAAPKRKFTSVMERDKNFNAQSQYTIFTFTPEGDPLPALKHLRVGMNPGSSHFKVIDRRDGKERVSVQVTENFNQFMYPTQNMGNPNFMPFPGNMTQPQPNHFSYHSVGHLIVANVGQWLVAVDAVTHRKLWDKNLLGDHGPGTGGLLYNAADECLQLLISAGDMITLAQGGPVQPGYVSLLTRDGLMALDPLTGKTLWVRNDVTTHCRLFGDARHIYLVELNNDGTAGTTRAFRAQDGASVPMPNFASLYQKKERVIGRELVVADNQSSGLMLRLYDVHTGKDLWSQKFPTGSVVMHSVDPDLAGVLNPSDGHFNIISISRRKVVGGGTLTPKDVKNLKQAHLLADNQNFYVALQTTDTANPNNEAWENLQSNTGLRDLPVNGFVYAFDRRNSRIKWFNEVIHQKLVLEQWREIPAMLFTSRYTPGGNPMVFRGGMPNQQWGDVYIEAYDKATGKLFYKMPTKNGEAPMGQQYQLVYAVNYDAANGKVEMIANNYKLTITQEGEATSAAATGGKEEKAAPKPAAQGGRQTGSADVVPREAPAQKKIVIIKD